MLPTSPKMVPYNWRGVVPEPVFGNRVKNGPASADQATMCTPLRAETCPPPPIPPFLLTQNLSSKQIVPTDNMRLKSDDAIWHHRLLKG